MSLKYILDIDAMPTPRPRLGKFGTYNPPNYTKYKKGLVILLKSLNIPKEDYSYVKIFFRFPYPASTPKKNRLDEAPMRYKYDIDNLLKGFFDALQDAGIVQDDRRIAGVYAEKFFTNNQKGCIEFELE